MSLIPKKGTVYVVDDDEAVRDSLQWLLEGKDYRVRCFDSAETFISRYDPREVACLIADIRMGGMTGLELMLQLIGRSHGPALVDAISETLLLEQVRSESGPPQMSYRRALGSTQPKLREAIALMEANLEEPIELDKLARYVELSRRQLERLFCQYLHCSPSRYYLKLRLFQARQLLKQTTLPIVEVANNCGFLSPPHFAKRYREHFGVAPSNERLSKPQRYRLDMH